MVLRQPRQVTGASLFAFISELCPNGQVTSWGGETARPATGLGAGRAGSSGLDEDEKPGAEAAVAAQVSLAVAAKASAENFPVALRVLPSRWRAHLTALYGFARLVDDIGDEPLPGMPPDASRGDGHRNPPRAARRAAAGRRAGLRRRRGGAWARRHQGPGGHRPRVRHPQPAALRPHPGQPPGPARHQVRDLPGPRRLLPAVREPGRPGGALHHGRGHAGADRRF